MIPKQDCFCMWSFFLGSNKESNLKIFAMGPKHNLDAPKMNNGRFWEVSSLLSLAYGSLYYVSMLVYYVV